MANTIVTAFVICSYLFAAQVVHADRNNHLACATVPDGTYIRSTKSCSHYYLCQKEAIAIEDRCPDKYLFNDAKQLCDYDNFVNCNSCVQYGRRFYADPRNCTRYFQCVNSLRRTYHCPHGQMFEEVSNRCQRSEDVDCRDEGDENPEDPDYPEDPTEAPTPDPEWPIPGGEPTRPPSVWGPPRPGTGQNNEHPPPPENPPEDDPGYTTTTTRRPGGIGTWRPTTTTPDPDHPTEPTSTTPWGPPNAPPGSGGGMDEPEPLPEE